VIVINSKWQFTIGANGLSQFIGSRVQASGSQLTSNNISRNTSR
jgi:hypothetical protein